MPNQWPYSGLPQIVSPVPPDPLITIPAPPWALGGTFGGLPTSLAFPPLTPRVLPNLAEIDVARIVYQFTMVNPVDGTPTPLTPTALSWNEQDNQVAVGVQASFPNAALPQGSVHQLLGLGTLVFLYADWGGGLQEVFRGVIFYWKYNDQGAQTVDVIAYDFGMYLQLTQDNRSYNLGVFNPFTGYTLPPLGGSGSDTKAKVSTDERSPSVGWTAGQILRDVANAWGFQVDGLDLLGLPMPPLQWKNTKLTQMIAELLDRTWINQAGAFLFRVREGRYEVVLPAANRPIYVLTDALLTNYSDAQDMRQLVTQVVIFGQDQNNQQPVTVGGTSSSNLEPTPDGVAIRMPIAVVVRGRIEYGVMSQIVDDPAASNDLLAATFGAQLLLRRGTPIRTQTFTAPDLPFLRRGDAVEVHAGTLDGIFIINAISHDAVKRQMQLTIDSSGGLVPADNSFAIVESTDRAVGVTQPSYVGTDR